MKKISFKIKFDDEFKDYYITPFKNDDSYVWLNDIVKDDKNNLVMITEYGFIDVEKIDYENMKVICTI